MNIDDFRYITTIAETGNLSTAAKALYITQPSLSQRVKYVENAYDITIFNRGMRGVELTEEGKTFVRFAEQILRAEMDLRYSIGDMHSLDRSPLRVGTPQLIASSKIGRLLIQFHSEFPGIHLDCTEHSSLELQEMLQSNKLDIAICSPPIVTDGLNASVISRETFVVVPALGGSLEARIREEGLLPGSYIQPGMLEGESFATSRPGTKMYHCLEMLQAEHGVNINPIRFGGNFAMFYSVAQAGIASTILLESFFTPESEHLPYYFLEGISSEDNLIYMVVWRKSAYLRQTAKAFIDIARANFI